MVRGGIVVLLSVIHLGLALARLAPLVTLDDDALADGDQTMVYSMFDISPNDRDLCPETEANKPLNRVYTAARVERLRAAMRNSAMTGGEQLAAYIIHNGDEHLGKATDHDRRLQYMSGFSGTYGYAAITATKAALWTDGRYFLQADQQLDCGWILMKQGTSGTPSLVEWLKQEVSDGLVGADPKLVSITNWLSYSETLSMYEVPTDLVDQAWTDHRPARLNNLLDIHNMTFAGKMWQDKVSDVRQKLREGDMDAQIVTALDETAWLFNLRGRDRLTSPLFDAYTILTHTDVRLYIRNMTKLLTSSVLVHLNTQSDGSCVLQTGPCVEVYEYNDLLGGIQALNQRADINKTLVSPKSNYAIFSAAGEKRELANSPIALMKSIKNPVERTNYYKCQVRDSAAVVEFSALLEKEMGQGKHWTEISAGDKLSEIRSTYDFYWGMSFQTISSAGPNAAMNHYRPDNNTDRTLTTKEIYLLDSGGQYQDGTTDVTRTYHFGTPTEDQKEAYTRVLMAHIDLATTVWPAGYKGSQIDARTRAALWERGWDYRHGTGHGIGYFLNVHEGPASIGLSPGSQNPTVAPLHEGMFFSDEPGFYRDGEYGVRLESIMEIVKANTKEQLYHSSYLTFNAATLVPFEPKFLLLDLLTIKQRKWINAYNKRCLKETGGLLLQLGKQEAYDWLKVRTTHIPDVPRWDSPTNSAIGQYTSLEILVSSLFVFMISTYLL